MKHFLSVLSEGRHSSIGETFILNPKSQLNWGNLHSETKVISHCFWQAQCTPRRTRKSITQGSFFLRFRRHLPHPSVPFQARLQQVVLIRGLLFSASSLEGCPELYGICVPLRANLTSCLVKGLLLAAKSTEI